LFPAPGALEDGDPKAAAGFLGSPMKLPFADSGPTPLEGSWPGENNFGAGSAQVGWLTQQFDGAGMAARSEPIADPGANASSALPGAFLHHG
jgi:hypothetical protein